MTPYNTGKVAIGARYVEPARPPEMGREAERLQAALLDKRSRFERALDWIDTHPWLTLAVCSALVSLYHWIQA
jgi:hypothetical protein